MSKLGSQKFWFSMGCVLSLGLFITACNDTDVSSDSLSTSSAAVLEAYNGPGSKWDFNLYDDDTFLITMRESVSDPISLIVEGTYERLASGFLLLEVASASGDDAPSSGDTAWALEVPGYALLLKPMDGDSDQIIPMVTAGDCPTQDFTANWVIVKKSSSATADDADRDFFGVFDYDAASESAILPTRRALANSFQDGGEEPLGNGTCANGIMEISDAEMYLTSNGGAIVHTGIDDPDEGSFIFGLTQKLISNVNNLDGSYAGILFDQSSGSGDRIQPVSMTCSAGTCTANIVDDIQTNDLSAETVTVNLSGTPDDLADGLITGTITNGTSGTLACMADINVLGTTDKMVSCVGQSPGDNQNMFNVIFTTK